MIAQQLIGCRVYKSGDPEKTIIGKIVGHFIELISDYHQSSRSEGHFLILKEDKTFESVACKYIIVADEDFEKIYFKLKSDTVDLNRFEILDFQK